MQTRSTTAQPAAEQPAAGRLRRCRRCRQPIIGRRSNARYCSELCKDRQKKGVPLDSTRPCQHCQTPFKAKPRQVYCSVVCRSAADYQRTKNGNRPDRRPETCELCGGGFLTRKYSQRYCSLSCSTTAANRRHREKTGRRKKPADPFAISQAVIYRRARAIRLARPAGWLFDDETVGFLTQRLMREDIRELYATGEYTMRELAALLGVAHTHVWQTINGRGPNKELV